MQEATLTLCSEQGARRREMQPENRKRDRMNWTYSGVAVNHT